MTLDSSQLCAASHGAVPTSAHVNRSRVSLEQYAIASWPWSPDTSEASFAIVRQQIGAMVDDLDLYVRAASGARLALDALQQQRAQTCQPTQSRSPL